MDESRYLALVKQTFERLIAAFDDVDPDVADLDATGDVLTVTCRGGARLVVNTQRPARQIRLAGGGRGWHFDWDEPSGCWRDARRGHAELVDTLRALVQEHAGHALEVR